MATKFVMGRIVTDMAELCDALSNDEWLYWLNKSHTHGKPVSAAWLSNFSWSTLNNALKSKRICCAILRDKAAICGYGDCGNRDCPHSKVHLAGYFSTVTHYCDYVFGPVRCIPLAEWEARHA